MMFEFKEAVKKGDSGFCMPYKMGSGSVCDVMFYSSRKPSKRVIPGSVCPTRWTKDELRIQVPARLIPLSMLMF